MSLMAMVMAFVLMACNDSVKYNSYKAIPEEGWGRRDSLVFSVDTISSDGRYTTLLCVRTNSEYPYRYLSLDARVKTFPDNGMTYRTVRMEVKQEDGISLGKGINYHLYEVPVMTQNLRKGDSISVIVRHHMRREYMPGITDVGIKVERR